MYGSLTVAITIKKQNMSKLDLVLVALAPGGGYRYAPVQVQKLIFLIDREIPTLVGGPHFNFTAYHYGPFDKHVYHALDELARAGHVDVDDEFSRRRTYALTPEGLNSGMTTLNNLHENAQAYIRSASNFVRNHSFSELVSAIYKAYPEMQANSVFQH